MIDCHNHMLPGIDDGARDLAYALEMARKAVDSGTNTVVLTPHHLNGVYTNRREDILAAVALFQKELVDAGIALTVLPGSELHLVPELPDQINAGEALTYADLGKAALVELPASTVPLGAEPILENILYLGITPVIAHPERNAELCANPDRIADWINEGCGFQVTSQSCTGLFGDRIREVSRYWCERGWIHLISSDAHRVERRSPDMRGGAEAIQRWLGDEASKIVLQVNPERLVTGLNLQSPVKARAGKAKRKRFIGRKKGNWF